MYTEIGHRIKVLRGAVSQKDFAAKLGISLQGYLRYEYGKRIPPGLVLSRIAAIAGVTVDWILTGHESAVGADRVAETAAPYGLDDETAKIMDMLKGMTREQKREALRFIEGQKLLAAREKKLRKEAG